MLLSEVINLNKNIWLWGANSYCSSLVRIISNSQKTVLGIIDNDPKLSGKIIYNTKIFSPSEFGRIAKKDDYIVICTIKKTHTKDINTQLLNMGFKNIIIFSQCPSQLQHIDISNMWGDSITENGYEPAPISRLCTYEDYNNVEFRNILNELMSLATEFIEKIGNLLTLLVY